MLKKVFELLEQCDYLNSEEIKKRCAKPGSEADTLFMDLDQIALRCSSYYHTCITLQWKLMMNAKNSTLSTSTAKVVNTEKPGVKLTDIEGLAKLLAQSGIKAGDIGGE